MIELKSVLNESLHTNTESFIMIRLDLLKII